MHARMFTPENTEGFSAQELAAMNHIYARLSARRARAVGAQPDDAERERLRAVIRGVTVMLRGRGWIPGEADIIGEIERRKLDSPAP
jgi:hypothetical protein